MATSANQHDDTDSGSFAGRIKASVTGWDSTLKYVALFFATIELVPKRGVWAPTVLAVVLLFLWIVNRRPAALVERWRADKDIIRRWQLWWQPLAALLMLIAAWTCVYLNKLHVTIARPNYLFENSDLKIVEKQTGWAHEVFAHDPDQSSERLANKDKQLVWMYWMSRGVTPANTLSWVASESLKDSYADFHAVLKIDSDYEIHNPVAFLVDDNPRFAHDPHYRPRFRQMETILTAAKHELIITLDHPNKGEFIGLLCQVKKRDGYFVPITNLILGSSFEVR